MPFVMPESKAYTKDFKNKLDYIRGCWMDKGSFARYLDLADGDCKFGDDYDEFLTKQMRTLVLDDVNFIYSLCRRMRNQGPTPLKLMDEETCARFRAMYVFYGEDNSLTIANYR